MLCFEQYCDAHMGTRPDAFCFTSQNQLLAVSPWESNLDEQLFGPDAAQYNPCRNGIAGMGAIPGVGGIAGFAFGGGRYR